MTRGLLGSFHLFRALGIDVQVHWTWFLVAVIQMNYSHRFDSPAWILLVYLLTFGIVLLHEFGHALACRSVGGQANRIVLWPLGGIAFVRPPLRPGAVLWSIAAGPLVNVLLIPLTVIGYMFVASDAGGLIRFSANTDIERAAFVILAINIGMLLFNMLPVYPLDGGQILQSLLWFAFGLGRSLQITTVIGLTMALVGMAGALFVGHLWLAAIAGFVGWQSWKGYHNAQALLRMEAAYSGPSEGYLSPSSHVGS